MRPADSAETVAAWELTLRSHNRPTGLILSRQNIKDLPAQDRRNQAKSLEQGAYIVYESNKNPKIILLANGSEVSTLMDAVPILEAEYQLSVRIVSVPSEGLFRDQGKSYMDIILPADTPVFGLTAGLPSTLERLVGQTGVVFGLDHFGYSAPYQVLDEKFGFTKENVINQVISLLKI